MAVCGSSRWSCRHEASASHSSGSPAAALPQPPAVHRLSPLRHVPSDAVHAQCCSSGGSPKERVSAAWNSAKTAQLCSSDAWWHASSATCLGPPCCSTARKFAHSDKDVVPFSGARADSQPLACACLTYAPTPPRHPSPPPPTPPPPLQQRPAGCSRGLVAIRPDHPHPLLSAAPPPAAAAVPDCGRRPVSGRTLAHLP